MYSANLIPSDSSIFYSSAASLLDKETQTSNTDISVDSLDTISFVTQDTCVDKPLPKYLEHIEVVKNPENPRITTVIKDTFCEDVIDSSTSTNKSLSNRYKYCREVISPILSGDTKIFKPEEADADDVYQGFNSLTGIKENIIANMETTDTKTCKEPDEKCTAQKNKRDCAKTNKCPDCSKKRQCITKDKCPDCDKITREENKNYPFPYEDSCDSRKLQNHSKTSCKAANLKKKTSSSCVIKSIGIQQPQCPDDKPVYYVIEKPPEASSKTNLRKSSVEKIFPSDSGTMSSIKSTVQSFIGTMYQKTKNVISLVASESCKHLSLNTKSDSDCNKNDTKSKTDIKQPNKKISSVSFNQLTQDITPTTGSLETLMEPALEAVKKIASTVESTVSYVGEFGMEKIIMDRIESNMNRSSPLDVPTTISPREMTETVDPINTMNNMFETLKSKIYSMFGNSTKDSADDTDDFDE